MGFLYSAVSVTLGPASGPVGESLLGLLGA